MKELQILSPDGKNRTVPLDRERFFVGRATTVDLSYPNDSGLSRQHMLFERDGEHWTAIDLGSKNGTTLNGEPLTSRTILKPGDRLMAGHLILICGTANRQKPVVIVESSAISESGGEEAPQGATIITNLEGIMRASKGDSQGFAAAQVSALIRAGNELAGQRPLPELFR